MALKSFWLWGSSLNIVFSTNGSRCLTYLRNKLGQIVVDVRLFLRLPFRPLTPVAPVHIKITLVRGCQWKLQLSSLFVTFVFFNVQKCTVHFTLMYEKVWNLAKTGNFAKIIKPFKNKAQSSNVCGVHYNITIYPIFWYRVFKPRNQVQKPRKLRIKRLLRRKIIDSTSSVKKMS